MLPQKYVLLDKKVGETPLETLEAWRLNKPELASIPLAYAGRLDPMASGQLLVLVGEECKNQTEYHDLDKEYQVGILFGASSDSGDVLGLVSENLNREVTLSKLKKTLLELVGSIEFPYPIFSSKTVQGKPLHTWTMENRLHEITIPTRKSDIFKLSIDRLYTQTRFEVAENALTKIELIPQVTDPRKALGNDFRRPQVRQSWQEFKENGNENDIFYIADITCICSSGTYMRTLAEEIAKKLNTFGLAYSIHRSVIGRYNQEASTWSKIF
jgi:tRNA pseudouridine55 synthase